MYQLAVLSSNYHTRIKLKSGHTWPHHFRYKAYITVRIAVVLSDTMANYHTNKYPEHCDSNKKQICFQNQTNCEVFLCTTHTFRHSVFSVVTQKSLNLNRCLSVFIIVCSSSAVFYSHADNFKDRNTPDSKLWTNNIAPPFSLCCRFVHKHAGLILAMCLQLEIKLHNIHVYLIFNLLCPPVNNKFYGRAAIFKTNMRNNNQSTASGSCLGSPGQYQDEEYHKICGLSDCEQERIQFWKHEIQKAVM